MCGEEDRSERPARDGNAAGTGGFRRVVAAPRPHRQQLSGLDAAHLESTAMAVTVTDSEHKDGDGGGDCEDVRMEGGSCRSLGDRALCGRRGRGVVVVMPHV